MTSHLRDWYERLLSPLARLLLRLGISPTAVTVGGTALTVVAALWLLPLGRPVLGSLLVALFLLGDGLDGQLARLGNRQSRLGGFLDSTLDRLADGAILAGIGWWRLREGDELGLGLAIAVLVLGFLVSYARASAEVEGWDASVGLFERTDRLVFCLAGTLAVGLGAPVWILWAALAVVAVGSAVTTGQRITAAANGARGEPGAPGPSARR